jgi:hypothetical protein
LLFFIIPINILKSENFRVLQEAMARQAQKEATDLKQKLEDAKQKAKDAATDLQAVVEGESSLFP